MKKGRKKALLTLATLCLIGCGGSDNSTQIGSNRIREFRVLPSEVAENIVLDSAQSSEIIGYVGEQPISTDLLRYYVARKGLGGRLKPLTSESIDSIVNEIASVQMYKQAAVELNIDQRVEVALQIDRILASNYQQQLQKSNLAELKVTDEEVKIIFESSPERFSHPERRRGSVIALRFSINDSAQLKKEIKTELQRVRSEIIDSTDKLGGFGAAAKKHSQDVRSKRRNGDIGWILSGARVAGYEDQVLKALFNLQSSGDVSEIIEGERGFYLVVLKEVAETEEIDFKTVAAQIKREVLVERQSAMENTAIEALENKYPVKIDKSRIQSFIDRVQSENTDNKNRPPAFPVSVSSTN